MAKKSLGYVELEWTCPNCGGRNSGQETVCVHCGTAQPKDVSFDQPAEEKIITDAKVIEKVKLGPDIHCAFCGTRNPGDATTCINCGADLAEGLQRESGAVLGAHRQETAVDIKCQYCGTMNPGTARRCANCGSTLQLEKETAKPQPIKQDKKTSGSLSRWILIALGIVLLISCIAGFIFLSRTEDISGQVNNVSWERKIVLLGLVRVNREAWRDEVPSDADLGVCRQEHRYTSDNPQPNSTELCGTPYSVDKGSGFAEVVQECQYQVYDDLCQYSALELQPVDTLGLTGTDLNPQWPAVRLQADQQEGEREESYRVVFRADGEQYTFTTRDPQEFAKFVVGTNWTLKVNQLGGVVEVEPAPK